MLPIGGLEGGGGGGGGGDGGGRVGGESDVNKIRCGFIKACRCMVCKRGGYCTCHVHKLNVIQHRHIYRKSLCFTQSRVQMSLISRSCIHGGYLIYKMHLIYK